MLELDICQLVFQLGGVTALDHLLNRRQRDCEHEVVIQRPRVENAVVGRDLEVQPDEALCPVEGSQFVFSGDAPVVFLSFVPERFLLKSFL